MAIPIISLYRPFTYHITFEGTPRYILWKDIMEKKKEKKKGIIDMLKGYLIDSNPNRRKFYDAVDHSDNRSPSEMKDGLENIPKDKKKY